jgi:LuxR family maltose regulon positive regulatory protein
MVTNINPPINEPLLHTKLELPNLAQRIVRRDTLTGLLQNKGERRFSVIIAPAGYGKTTLLGEWLSFSASSENRFAWVTLDIFDNSSFRFWTYVISALDKAIPQLEFTPARLIQHGYDPLDFTRLIPLINEIGSLPCSINLILDDYHVISNDQIHKSLAYFIENQPRNFHLVVASRIKPPLPFSRLRMQGRLTELDIAEISFTLDETRKYLTDVACLEKTPRFINEIYKATQGWVAGLQLAAITISNHFPLSTDILSQLEDSDEFPDFFSEEVISQQDAQTREFLIKTSILSEFCADLCNSLLSVSNSQAIIDRIHAANLFITPLDKKGSWYRWHPLFSSALKRQLEKTYPTEMQNLHSKAVDWYMANGYPDKAVVHTLTINQMEKAAELIDSLALNAISNFDLNRLIHWINAIPDHLFELRPSLGIYNAAACFLQSQYEMIDPILKKTEEIIQNQAVKRQNPAEINKLKWELNAIRTSVECIAGNSRKGVAQGVRLISNKSRDSNYLYAMLVHAIGIGYESLGELSRAIEMYELGRQLGSKNNFLYGHLHSTSALAFTLKSQGRLTEAIKEFMHAFDFATEYKLESAAITLAQSGLLEIALEQDFKDAHELAKDVIANFGKTISSESAWISHIQRCLYLVNYFLSKSNIESAAHYFELAESSYHELISNGYPPPLEIIDVRVRYLRTLARQAGAQDWFKEEDDYLNTKTFKSIPGRLARARILLGRQEYASAADELNRLMAELEPTELNARKLEAKVLLALAQYGNGQIEPALLTVNEALHCGYKEGFVRTFSDEGDLMKDLLCEFDRSPAASRIRQENTVLAAYLDKLLRKMEVECTEETHPSPEIGPRVTSLLPIQEPLSGRESEVLRLLLQSKTAKEIADLLMISINTAKTHIKSIYRKYGVHSHNLLIQRVKDLESDK